MFVFCFFISKSFQPLMLNVLQCLLFSHKKSLDQTATQRKGASGTYKQRKFKQYNLTVPLLWRLRAPPCKSNLYPQSRDFDQTTLLLRLLIALLAHMSAKQQFLPWHIPISLLYYTTLYHNNRRDSLLKPQCLCKGFS